jgi:hypothetical protein
MASISTVFQAHGGMPPPNEPKRRFLSSVSSLEIPQRTTVIESNHASFRLIDCACHILFWSSGMRAAASRFAALASVMCCTIAAVGVARAQDVEPSLNHVVAVLRKSESAARFIKTETYSSILKWNGREYERGGEMMLETVRDFFPGGRLIAEAKPHTCFWGTKGVFVESNQSIGYNGRVSWDWAKSWREEGSPALKRNDVDLYAGKCPMIRTVGTESGWDSTVHGAMETMGVRLSEAIESEGAWVWSCSSTSELGGGVELQRKDGSRQDIWILRRDWAYAAKEYKKVIDGAIVEHMVVEDAVKLRDDLYWPRKIVRRTYDSSGAREQYRREIEILDAVVMDTVADSVFDPVFERGTRVRDVLSKSLVVVAGDDTQLGSIIKSQGGKLAELMRGEQPTAWWRWLAGLCGGILLLVLAWNRKKGRSTVRTRAKRSNPMPGVGLVLSWLCCAPAICQTTWALDELPGAKVENCAVNAVSLVAEVMGKVWSLDEVALALRVGERRLAEANMADMSSVLESLGLEVVGLRISSIKDLAESLLRNGGIAIVHSNTSGNAGGHYTVVARAASGSLAIADPGWWLREIDWTSAAATRYSGGFSGACLLVRKGGERVARSLNRGSRWQMPLVATGPDGRHLASDWVRNDVGHTVQIVSHAASCGCVAAATLEPANLLPGQIGRLQFTVDPAGGAGFVQASNVSVMLAAPGQASSVFPVQVDLVHEAVEVTTELYAFSVPSLAIGRLGSQGRFQARIGLLCSDGSRVMDCSGAAQVSWTEAEVAKVPGPNGGLVRYYDVCWEGEWSWIQWRVQVAKDNVKVARALLRS